MFMSWAFQEQRSVIFMSGRAPWKVTLPWLSALGSLPSIPPKLGSDASAVHWAMGNTLGVSVKHEALARRLSPIARAIGIVVFSMVEGGTELGGARCGCRA